MTAPTTTILTGDVRERLAELPDASVQCVVPSPPYWQLRDYDMIDQIGLEESLQAWVATLVAVFHELRRLRADGTVWLNLGDGYAAGGKGGGGSFMAERKDAAWRGRRAVNGWRSPPAGLKARREHGTPLFAETRAGATGGE